MLDSVLRALVAPQDKLEDRVKAFPLFDRQVDNRLGLIQTQHSAATEQRSVAKQQHIIVRPKIEMTEPELLVDQPESLVNDGGLFFGDADFR